MKKRQRQDESLAAVKAARNRATRPSARVTAIRNADERPRLGEVLVSEHGLAREQIWDALNRQAESGVKLGAILVQQGLIDQHVLNEALATQLGLPTVDLRHERPSSDALAVVSEELARQYSIIPLRVNDDVLDVAITDGFDAEVRDVLKQLPVRVVNVFLAAPLDVESFRARTTD